MSRSELLLASLKGQITTIIEVWTRERGHKMKMKHPTQKEAKKQREVWRQAGAEMWTGKQKMTEGRGDGSNTTNRMCGLNCLLILMQNTQ